jgi:hypothetical protein
VEFAALRWTLVISTFALAACASPEAVREVAVRAEATSTDVEDCGDFVLGQREEPPDSAVRCFVEAVRAGRAGRLKVSQLTTEGDPILLTYTAGADGKVILITDSRQDSFGAKEITRQTCALSIAKPVSGRLDLADCSEPTPG